MESWQIDIASGVILAGGGEAKIVSTIDDHSRFIISAHVVPRATARPTCDGLEKAVCTQWCVGTDLDGEREIVHRLGSGVTLVKSV